MICNAQSRARPYGELGTAIKRARLAARLSRDELSRDSGTNIVPSFISYIERGEKRPSPEVLKALCRTLGLDFTTMSALAGYADAPHGDVAVYTTADKAPVVRRLVERYGATELTTWERMMARFLLRARHEEDAGAPAEQDAEDEQEQSG